MGNKLNFFLLTEKCIFAMIIYIFCFFIIAQFSAINAHKFQRGYTRVMFQAKDVSGNATNSVASILDPGQQRIQNFGNLYDAISAQQIKNAALNFFNYHCGLNFSAGTFTSIGSYALVDPETSSYPYPYALLLPYANGDDYKIRLVMDSAHPERGESGKWISFSAGYLVLMNATGTFKSGVKANTTYESGDVMGHVYYNFLNEDKQSKWNDVDREGRYKHREIILTRSEVVTKQVVNGQGFTEQHVKETIIDENGNHGLNIGGTFVEKLADGTIVQNTRNILTFPGMISHKLPKH